MTLLLAELVNARFKHSTTQHTSYSNAFFFSVAALHNSQQHHNTTPSNATVATTPKI
jgi:hypothetical protein